MFLSYPCGLLGFVSSRYRRASGQLNCEPQRHGRVAAGIGAGGIFYGLPVEAEARGDNGALSVPVAGWVVPN